MSVTRNNEPLPPLAISVKTGLVEHPCPDRLDNDTLLMYQQLRGDSPDHRAAQAIVQRNLTKEFLRLRVESALHAHHD